MKPQQGYLVAIFPSSTSTLHVGGAKLNPQCFKLRRLQIKGFRRHLFLLLLGNVFLAKQTEQIRLLIWSSYQNFLSTSNGHFIYLFFAFMIHLLIIIFFLLLFQELDGTFLEFLLPQMLLKWFYSHLLLLAMLVGTCGLLVTSGWIHVPVLLLCLVSGYALIILIYLQWLFETYSGACFYLFLTCLYECISFSPLLCRKKERKGKEQAQGDRPKLQINQAFSKDV